MALIGRIFVILFAFLIASLAASMVLQLGIVLPFWRALVSPDINQNVFSVVVGFGFFFISVLAFVPAIAIVAAAEAFRLRSVLFYAVAGGLEALVIAYSLGSGLRSEDIPLAPLIQVFAAAGIVAGFVYWLLAGRNAGRWCEQRATAP